MNIEYFDIEFNFLCSDAYYMARLIQKIKAVIFIRENFERNDIQAIISWGSNSFKNGSDESYLKLVESVVEESGYQPPNCSRGTDAELEFISDFILEYDKHYNIELKEKKEREINELKNKISELQDAIKELEK